jgi:hypothetical protein
MSVPPPCSSPGPAAPEPWSRPATPQDGPGAGNWAPTDEIDRRLAQGKRKVRMNRVFPLSVAAAAHRLIEDPTPLAGKIALVP